MWKGCWDAADKDLVSMCDCTSLSTAPDPPGASRHDISTVTTAALLWDVWTKGTVEDFCTSGSNWDTHTGTPRALVCHWQVGTSVQDHSLELSHQFPNNVSRTDVGKSQENTGNNLLPCFFVGHAIFFCTSMLIELLEVLLPHKSFPFPKWNVSISADSVAPISASIAFWS